MEGRATWWGELRDVVGRRDCTSRGTARVWVGAPTSDTSGEGGGVDGERALVGGGRSHDPDVGVWRGGGSRGPPRHPTLTTPWGRDQGLT